MNTTLFLSQTIFQYDVNGPLAELVRGFSSTFWVLGSPPLRSEFQADVKKIPSNMKLERRYIHIDYKI